MFCGLASIAEIPSLLMRGTAGSRRLVSSNAAGMTYTLPESYVRKIAVLPHVKIVQAWEFLPSQYRSADDQFLSYAMDPIDMRELFPEWGISADAAGAFERQRTAALVGPKLMRRHQWRVGDKIIVHGTLPRLDVPLQIVGELNPGTASSGPLDMLAFRRDYYESLRADPGRVTLIWTEVDSLRSIDPVIASIDETFANSEHETRTAAEGQFTRDVFSSLASIFTLAAVLGVIVVGVVTLVAANTAAMSIRERRGEIAVMRSMGFTSRTILSLLLAESLLIGLIGGVLGCGSAYLVLKIFSVSAVGGGGPLGSIQMPVPILVETLIVAALIGLLSAIVPAQSAARRNIVDALRTVA